MKRNVSRIVKGIGLGAVAAFALTAPAFAAPPPHAPAHGYRARQGGVVDYRYDDGYYNGTNRTRYSSGIFGRAGDRSPNGDFDGDGVPNRRDRDIDGDGIRNREDRNDYTVMRRPRGDFNRGDLNRGDFDRDGRSNRWDRDDDNDGRRDRWDDSDRNPYRR